MGQNNTGVVMRSGAETTLRYLQAKKKNRKTLTLKKSQDGNKPFKTTASFAGGGVRRTSRKTVTAVESIIPVLTSPVIPAAADNLLLDAIPVLDNPVSGTIENSKQRNFLIVTTVFFVVLVMGAMLFGGTDQDPTKIPATENLEPAMELMLPIQTEVKPAVKVIDKSLIKNIVELINQEQFSQDSTIEAFLSLWQQVDGGTRATLNSTPWFLRFVFSLQKQSRLYLQSPDSYNTDYTIKINSLLKMALELGVMDQHGIESSVETYHSKQNQLFETIRSEIAVIEHAAKNQEPRGQSIDELNKSFRERFAVKPLNTQKDKTKITSHKTVKNEAVIPPRVNNEVNTEIGLIPQVKAINDKTAIEAMALDALVNSFIDAYERGDLEKLTALFSPTARTNDKNNLESIRQDYRDLFNSSSFRLLNIFNLRWEPSHNAIKGIGDYEIGIAMDKSGIARTLHGKIQFVIGKVNDQLRITRLYHLER